jgi:hypothetical protein
VDSAALLAAWEDGLSLTAPQRAVSLLALAWPERSEAEWRDASIGERDSRLLRLREELFGSRLDATAQCPRCSERVELCFTANDIRIPTHAGADLTVRVAGYEIRFRLPNTSDLLDVARAEDQETALMARCVREVTRDGVETGRTSLPREAQRAVADRMAEADPAADIQIALTCPNCAHSWPMPFEIVSYLWTEIGDWARRLLVEVHSLAAVYHWSEADILAMSSRRRRMYLDMIGA